MAAGKETTTGKFIPRVNMPKWDGIPSNRHLPTPSSSRYGRLEKARDPLLRIITALPEQSNLSLLFLTLTYDGCDPKPGDIAGFMGRFLKNGAKKGVKIRYIWKLERGTKQGRRLHYHVMAVVPQGVFRDKTLEVGGVVAERPPGPETCSYRGL